jgi:hypothetical protein
MLARTALLMLSFSLVACKAREPDSKAMNGVGQPCQFQPVEGVNDQITRAAKADPETMLLAANCKHLGRNMVAEKSRTQGFRTIDAFQCPPIEAGSDDGDLFSGDSMKNFVFFAHPNEMITSSQKDSAFHYYKIEDGRLNFKGNSFTKGNPCLKCHATGGLVMKELAFPWRHWLGNAFEEEPTDEEKAVVGVDRQGQPRKIFAGPFVEQAVRVAGGLVAQAYKKGLLEGREELKNETLSDLLKPLFCTVDINIATHIDGMSFTGNDNSNSHPEVHAEFIGDSLIIDPINPISISTDWDTLETFPSADAIREYLAKKGIPGDIVAIPTPGEGSMARFRMLPFEEAGRAIIDPSIVVAARLVDFPNPIFSKKRCGLWKHIPPTPISELATPKAIKDKLKSSFAGVNEAAAKEFLEYVDEKMDSTFNMNVMVRIGEFVDACVAEGSALRNIDQLYRLVRARTIPLLQTTPLKYFQKIEVVEHFPNNENSPSKVFPEYQAIIDGKFSADEGLALNEKCQLVNE